jgi:cytochrome oxidase Cu insertion factor (SCO1/SenC/PrrC family)
VTGRLLSLASLAVALAGAIGYFSLLRIPTIRNHFGLALAALGVSVLLAVLAMGMRRGLLPVIALAVSVLLFGGGAFFHFWFSRLPAGVKVAVGQPAPDFTLPDARGQAVTLSSFKGQKAVVLVFYRGYW